MLYRYRHFERRPEIQEDELHQSRGEKLNGQNIFQTVKRLAKPMTIEELTKIANEHVTVNGTNIHTCSAYSEWQYTESIYYSSFSTPSSGPGFLDSPLQ